MEQMQWESANGGPSNRLLSTDGRKSGWFMRKVQRKLTISRLENVNNK